MEDTLRGVPSYPSPNRHSVQPLNKFQPVPLRVLSVNDSEFAIPVGSELRFGDESNSPASQFGVGLPEILHIETDMAGAELMLVQIALTGRRIDEVNQLDLMVSREAHKDQLPTRPGECRCGLPPEGPRSRFDAEIRSPRTWV